MIELSGVYKSFGRRSIFENLNFTVKQNEWIYLYGESGSGKSTLLKMIAALIRPDVGSIRVGGFDISGMRLNYIPYFRRRIGFIFQEPSLLQHENILNNVMYPLIVQGISVSEARNRALSALNAVNIEAYSYDLPQHLSGGQQQLASIARAIVSRPEIIIADEPTANLDKSNADMLIDTLKKFHLVGATCIISTHVNFSDSENYRRVLLSDSKIKEI